MSGFDLLRKVHILEARIKQLEDRVATLEGPWLGRGIENPQESTADLIEAYTQKFGKKPHHFMSEKTIREKLNGR